MKVHISTGNSKLGTAIPTFNLAPCKSCRADAPCRKFCYACKGRFRFGNVRTTLDDNMNMWNESPLVVEETVTKCALGSKYFRWHSAGDIPSKEYLNMMVRIARKCRGTKFLCFTKKYEIVNEWISDNGNLPKNLIVVLSSWASWKPENPHNLPVAYVRLKPKNVHKPYEIPVTANKCNGFCGECVNTSASCWKLNKGESVVFDQH